VAFPLDLEFLRMVDKTRGHASRSQFVREALAAYLHEKGLQVPYEMVGPPDRTNAADLPPVETGEDPGDYHAGPESKTDV
jgi:hypothetical protein